MDELSDEELAIALSKAEALDRTTSLVVPRVCRRWHRVSTVSRRTARLARSSFLAEREALSLLSRFPDLHSLTLSKGSLRCLSGSLFLGLGRALTSLRSLTVHSLPPPPGVPFSPSTPPTGGFSILAPSLTALRWRCKWALPPDVGLLTYLTSLSVRSGWQETSLPAAVSSLSRLRRLKLTRVRVDLSILKTLSCLTKLHVLDGDVFCSTEKLPKLRRLRDLVLQHGGDIMWGPVRSLLAPLSNLTSLRLLDSISRDHSGDDFPEVCLLPSSASLRALHIDVDGFDEVLDALPRFSKLEDLSLLLYWFRRSEAAIHGLKALSLHCFSAFRPGQSHPEALGEAMENRTPAFAELKELIIENLHGYGMDASISCLTTLESLSLLNSSGPGSRFGSSIHDNIGRLTGLKSLDLQCLEEGNREFVQLPESLKFLVCLTKLSVAGMKYLEPEFSWLGSLTSLELLELSALRSLLSLPASLGNLRMLKSLTLDRLERVPAVPESVGRLGCLTRLSLQTMPAVSSLPDSLRLLSSLRTIELIDLPQLRGLPKTLSQLSALWEMRLDSLPLCSSLSRCTSNLTSLKKVKCARIPFDLFGSLTLLSSLRYLNVGDAAFWFATDGEELLAALPRLKGALVRQDVWDVSRSWESKRELLDPESEENEDEDFERDENVDLEVDEDEESEGDEENKSGGDVDSESEEDEDYEPEGDEGDELGGE